MKLIQWVLIGIACVLVLSCRNAGTLPADTEEDSGADSGELVDTGEEKEKDTGEEKEKDTGEKKEKDTGEEKEKDTGEEKDKDTQPAGPRAGKKALVIIVDNSQSMADGTLDDLYSQYPDEIGGALADLYQQPKSEILSRSLTEIAEDFGEDWIIEDIEDKAAGHYAELTSLTDDQATLKNFLSAIEGYRNQGLVVDIIIDLHGSSGGEIVFYDDTYSVEDVTERMDARDLDVSVVYQTVCFGSVMVEEWVAAGLHGVNGSVGDNFYVNFAPGAFLKHWISGTTYDAAVQQARTDDMTEMQARLSQAASENIELLFLLAVFDFDAQSLQIVDGEFPQINW